ncbi:D-aminoacyl-tRNA deacylase [Granulosicoccus sp. 3-233]|uniref:D-aminoacyl-tRNA deacylase n=1 Tax=Granulosicoccus sp. 3-233 TaxID=3417969 RepID=UPI003D32C0F0
MIALIQRVTRASVTIDNQITARIDAGMLALIGVQRPDTHESVVQLAEKMLGYRVFEDDQGKMNRDIRQGGGQLLLVPQFTLAADTHKGRRPGFSSAASPQQANELFDTLVSTVSRESITVARGTFGADMQVALINDGPVTFWLETRRSV